MANRDQKRRRPATSVSESPLSATWKRSERERSVLVGVGPDMQDPSALDELAALAETAGAEPVARVLQPRRGPDPATYVGKGKLRELHDQVHASRADAVIFDAELSPGQLRNLEERLGTKVIDRTALILDIFALHARSREGKTQVELAQLNYLLPRLRGWGEAMSRLGGGIGTRGPGETKLEIDRQHIGKRITKLRREMKDLTRTREVKSSRRRDSGLSAIALAGYTNSGKSTLMNALTHAGVLVGDQLFATLDPTTRRFVLPGGRTVTISDTVGFVGKLPHELVEAFRSTLEEVTEAGLILHIADMSSIHVGEQIAAVREVLGEIGAGDIPEILVLNKADLADDERRDLMARRFPEAHAVSGKTSEGLRDLIAATEAGLPGFPIEVTVLIPYGREDLVALLHRNADVLKATGEESGTLVHARVGEREFNAVKDLIVGERES